MSVHTQTEMFSIVLEFMQDGVERTRKELKKTLKDHLKYTEEDLSETTKSGVSVYESRSGWAFTYLQRAGLLEKSEARKYKVTEAGKDFYNKGYTPSEFTKQMNHIISENNPWNVTNKDSKDNSDVSVEDSSPIEQIENLIDEINETLYSEILEKILENDSDFFERLIVELLEKMGYGTGKVTQRSCDGGIDGLVTTDELGFRPIMTQAKRYAKDHHVGREDIQKFAGSLNGSPNGVFITTSTFTNTAVEYAKSCHTSKIILVDGMKLAKLMVKYNLGVSTERSISIKKIDNDYFE